MNQHQGAFWNPGNEPGYDWIFNFLDYSREEIEEKLDSAYLDPIPDASEKEFIVRHHKSHYFSFYIDHIVKLFPECDIVLTHQKPHMSFLWWQMCGGHDTVHDSYHYYKRDYGAIWNEIVNQTRAVEEAVARYSLDLEVFNMDWIEKYYGKPSILAQRRVEEVLAHPDGFFGGLPPLMGNHSDGRNIANSVRVAIKLGTPRQW